MLTEPQAKQVEGSWERFTKTLNNEQLRAMYFRMDDLMQYGLISAATIAYGVVGKAHRERRKYNNNN